MTLFSLEELTALAKPFDIRQVLKKNAYQNKPLSFDDAYLLGVFMLYPYKASLDSVFSQNKRIAEVQSITAMSALHNKATYLGNRAAEQIAGICTAVFDYDIAPSQLGFVTPKVDYVIDNCGMGGDLLRTPNVSSLAAIIAAASGINVLKHGSPGNTDSVGSSDFLATLGVELFAKKSAVERGVEETHFGYTDAVDTRYKTIHVQTHKTAMLPHMNDIIGPITNPADPSLMKYRIVGVNHLIRPETVAEAYRILNDNGVTHVRRGLFVRGFADENHYAGMGELSTLAGGTSVAELKHNGNIELYELYANDFGLPTARNLILAEIGISSDKAAFGKQILLNKANSSAKDLILANTAAIFYAVNGTPLEEGVEKARDCLDTKNPIRVIEAYNSICRGYKDD